MDARFGPRTLSDLAARLSGNAWADIVGVAAGLGYLALAWLVMSPGEPPLGTYFALLAWTAAPVFVLYLHLVRQDQAISVIRLLGWAIAFRLLGLMGGPFFEDDFYRYLWDGYRFAVAGTPYGVAPDAFFLDASVPPSLQAALDQINHPELPTIYGPTTQLLFLLAYWLQSGSISALQLLLIAVDVGTIALLLRLAPARNVMLYAWCPLVIKEIAFTAHPDGLGVCLVLTAIVLAAGRRHSGAAVCLGLAAGAKVFALVLVPLVLVRAKLAHWLIFAATLAGLYAPFALLGGTDLDSLMTFAREWEFNSALFGLASAAMSATAAKVTLGVGFVAFWLWCYHRHRQRPEDVPRGDWLYGALLLVAPVINAWYLLWLLPFAAVYPSRWAWTASVAVLLSYVTGLTLGDYTVQAYAQPVWARLLQFGVIVAALAWDWVRFSQRDSALQVR